MAPGSSGKKRVRFGVFQADLLSGELTRRGRPVKLEGKPFQVLAALLRKPGEVLTREELQQELWSDDTFVEFDHGLNTAVNKIRDALGDSAKDPTFIETLHRRGYRFIAPIEPEHEPAPLEAPIVQGANQNRIQAAAGGRTLIVAATSALFGIVFGAGLAFVGVHEQTDSALPLRTFTLTSPHPNPRHVAISPDGKRIAYVAGDESSVWVQDLAQPEPRAIENTAGAYNPFWSPDSALLGFMAVEKGSTILRKVPLGSDQPTTICRLEGPVPYYRGPPTWSPDGNSIIVSTGRRLYEIPAGGGEAVPLEDFPYLPATPTIHPQFLPNELEEKAILFSTGGWFDPSASIYQYAKGRGLERVIDGAAPVYSASGHILYKAIGTGDLWALPYSAQRMQAVGDPFLVWEHVSSASVSADGTLVVLEGSAGSLQQLGWRDRGGANLGSVGQPRPRLSYPSLSPGDRFVAMSSAQPDGRDGETVDIWVHELRRSVTWRLTFDSPPDVLPVWSPNGNELLYSKQSAEGTKVYVKAADGSGEARLLFDGLPEQAVGFDWSANDRHILLRTPDGISHLERRGAKGEYELVEFLKTPFRENHPQLSPDHRLIAYTSDESGRREIYIREFPGGGGRALVSRGGGAHPRWNPSGGELFYVGGETLIAVPIRTEPKPSVGSPVELFAHPRLATHETSLPYDVAADGQRFLVIEDVGPNTPARIRVTQNWSARFGSDPRVGNDNGGAP